LPPPGGFISETFDNPTSFPCPNGLGLSWDIYWIFIVGGTTYQSYGKKSSELYAFNSE
jgi:hypothetical protein